MRKIKESLADNMLMNDFLEIVKRTPNIVISSELDITIKSVIYLKKTGDVSVKASKLIEFISNHQNKKSV